MTPAGTRPTVLLLDPVDGGAALAAAVGAQRAADVRTLLADRAATWARSVAGEVVVRPAGGESMADAARRAFDGAQRPLLIARPELPVWRALHGAAALSDLADGCGVAVGPVFDGGFYLVGLARPLPGLLELRDGPEAMNQAFVAAHEAGVEVGLLRAERGLRSAADVAAALADPLLDEELRGLLG